MNPFDQAWGVAKRDPRRPWLSGRRPDNIANPHDIVVANSILNRPQWDESKVEDDTEPPIDMGGDPCCINAKNQWIEALMSEYRSPSQSYAHISNYTENDSHGRPVSYNESIWEQYTEMPCEEFRLVLEQFAGLQPDKNIERWMKINDAERKLAQQLLEEWDECLRDTTFPDFQENMDIYLSEPREVKSPFDTAWGVTKGIIFGGREYDDINEVDDLITEILDDVNRKRPELPWKGGGPRRGTPWTAMHRAKQEGKDLNAPFHSLRGFTDSTEMLPTVLNWEGGKTQIQPQMRAIIQSLGRDMIPAELFGGSGSFILGQNTGKGLYSDINPDLVTVMRHLKAGMTIPHIPQNQDELEGTISELNALRRRRDVLGEDLDFDEERRLAQAFIGANIQHRNGMFNFGDWDEEPVRYTEGFIKRPSFRASDVRIMPHRVGSVDLRPYASRLKDVDIHEGDFRESAKHLTPHHVPYLDPAYISRDIDYGGTSQQQEGKEFDQMQRDVIRIGREHEGPSIISNYMYDKNTRKPLYGYIDALMEAGYDIHPWLRKPKANNQVQAELLALRGFPKQTRLKLFDR